MDVDQVLTTPLRRIPLQAGDVMHGLKSTDGGFAGFGEAYFTTIHRGEVKGWKRHNKMTLNFIVPCGSVRIVIQDADGRQRYFLLNPDSPETYLRLTVPPGLWVAFGGVSETLNLMLNVASLTHDPSEADNLPLSTYSWTW